MQDLMALLNGKDVPVRQSLNKSEDIDINLGDSMSNIDIISTHNGDKSTESITKLPKITANQNAHDSIGVESTKIGTNMEHSK